MRAPEVGPQKKRLFVAGDIVEDADRLFSDEVFDARLDRTIVQGKHLLRLVGRVRADIALRNSRRRIKTALFEVVGVVVVAFGGQAELQSGYVASFMRHELPEAFVPLLQQLLYKPDRNMVETKALEDACAQQNLSVARLLEKCGALTSSLDYHHGRFLFEYFPHGTGFEHESVAELADELELAPVKAFSIDDATTTEIDDAFSVTQLANGNWEIGVHIAAPALGIDMGSELDLEARKRMSTVYFPGGKITMLPESTIESFSLIEGCERPAVSMYIELNAELEMLGMRTTIERVHVARNLRHETIDMNFNEQVSATGQVDFEHGEQLLLLFRFANILEGRRGKKDASVDRVDYSFYVDDDRVRIVPRKRGSAIDKLVSELMIFVNGEWGRQLAEAKLPGLYRTQAGGKVRMSTVAAPHEGLGLGQYIWASSPLRRYADLANQRQLLSMVRGTSPAYAPSGEQLFEVMRGFELAYDAYAEQQRLMERYWCLRWLLQTDATDVQARVIRDDLVRIDGIPLVSRIQSLPQLARGERVQLRVSDIDLFELTLRGEYQRTLSAET